MDEFLWVDAICINQGEDRVAEAEKSHQIRMMRRIYENASHVLVWIGKVKTENEKNNHLAFLKMKSFDHTFEAVAKDMIPVRSWLWPHKPIPMEDYVTAFLFVVNRSEQLAIVDCDETNDTRRAWRGIHALWSSAWWTRTWIFQEASIPERTMPYFASFLFMPPIKLIPAGKKIRFMYGKEIALCSEVMATLMVSNHLSETSAIHAEILQNTQLPAVRFNEFRLQRILLNGTGSLLELLHLFRHTQCQDPRDKVYAPLCLAPKETMDTIAPNYGEKTTLDVYLQVAEFGLRQIGNELDFLGYTMYTNSSHQPFPSQYGDGLFPSWLPNWSQQTKIVPIPKVLSILEPRRSVILPSRIETKRIKNTGRRVRSFDASTQAPCSARIIGRQLNAQAVFCDYIEDIIPDAGPDINGIAAEKSRKWHLNSKHAYPTGEKFNDAMKRTHLMDINVDWLGRPFERGGMWDSANLHKDKSELSAAEFDARKKMLMAHTIAHSYRNICVTRK